MAVSKFSSSPSLVLNDCQRIMITLNKKSHLYTKLQLQIEFEYYHFRNRSDLTDISNRFNRAYELLSTHQVISQELAQIQIDKAACDRFINSAIAN